MFVVGGTSAAQPRTYWETPPSPQLPSAVTTARALLLMFWVLNGAMETP
jgi:hypothetical protein